MAKKVAVPTPENVDAVDKNIKKRHRCCTCCLVFLIVMLIIFGAAFGIGWYFGDKFTREQFGMSLSDTLGVLGDLYWTEDEDVVTRPYSKNDINGFYTELKRNILLKEDADVDFDSALVKAIDNYLASNNEGGKNAPARNSGEPDGEDEGSVMDIFADMIAEVLNRENIDFERLNAYDENDPQTDSYIFGLNDRQLAAFVNSVLKGVLKNASSANEILKGASEMINLSDVVALKQIRFAAHTVKDEDGAETVAATTADITVWIGLQDAARQAISYFMKNAGVGWLSGLVGWLGDVILPENVYITLTMPLYGEAPPTINFNEMNASERARAYKLINGMMNGDKSLDDVLNEFADKIKPYLEKAADTMTFDGIKDGTIEMDLLETVARMASGDDEEKEELTKADFLYLLQAFFSDPAEQYAMLRPYLFANRYRDGDDEVYLPSGSDTLELIDYEQEFVKAIEQKYAVKFEEGTELADVLAMMGISLAGNSVSKVDSDELVKLIDGKRFSEILEEDRVNPSSVKLKITDRMLAAAYEDELDRQLKSGDDDTFENLTVKLKALTFTRNDKDKDQPADKRRLYATLAVEVGLEEINNSLGSDSLMTRLASGLMPESILLTLTVDITRNRPEGYVKDDVEYVLNSCNNTDRAIKTLRKLVPSIDLDAMSERIEAMFNSMLDQLYKKLEVELVASTMSYDESSGWSGDGASLIMPDIFNIVNSNVLVKDGVYLFDDGSYLSNVLRALNDTSGVKEVLETLPPIATGDENFVKEVIKKYYLDADDIADFDGLIEFMESFDTGMLRVTGDDPETAYLAYDNTDIDELCPIMHSDELGYMLQQKMKDAGDISKYTIKNVDTGDDRLTIILEIKIDKLLPDNDVRFMLNTDAIYVTADILTGDDDIITDEKTGVKRYTVNVNINSMDADTYRDTLALIRFFNSSFDIDKQVSEIGEILYSQMDSLNKSMLVNIVVSPDDEPTDPSENEEEKFFSFTEDGLLMKDFYTFLASKMSKKAHDPALLKCVIQGLYTKTEVFGDNDNNYVLDDILCVQDTVKEEMDGVEFVTFTRDGGTYADVDFNSYLVSSVRSVANAKQANVEQTAILKAGDDNAMAQHLRTWANERLSAPLSDDSDYMFVTFSLGMDSYQSSDSTQDVEAFKLETVYVTVVYEFKDNSFNVVGSVFNDMTAEEYSTLKEFMNMSEESTDPTKVNIVSITRATVTGLRALTDEGTVSLAESTQGKGIGQITYSGTRGSHT